VISFYQTINSADLHLFSPCSTLAHLLPHSPRFSSFVLRVSCCYYRAVRCKPPSKFSTRQLLCSARIRLIVERALASDLLRLHDVVRSARHRSPYRGRAPRRVSLCGSSRPPAASCHRHTAHSKQQHHLCCASLCTTTPSSTPHVNRLLPLLPVLRSLLATRRAPVHRCVVALSHRLANSLPRHRTSSCTIVTPRQAPSSKRCRVPIDPMIRSLRVPSEGRRKVQFLHGLYLILSEPIR
jgi:hypothetical protein